MSLQFIIDGYNLTNHRLFTAINKKTKDQRLALPRLITAKRLCGSYRNKVMVIFDGYPDTQIPKEFANNFEVIFSEGQTADARIKKIVENSANPKNIVVVSDDKEIRFFVKSSGAKVLSIEEFLRPATAANVSQKRESLKPELNYSQINAINQELKKIWLKP